MDRFRWDPTDVRIRAFEREDVGDDDWGGQTLSLPVEGTYADRAAQVDSEVEHGWNHSLGQFVTGPARNGLRIELFDEKRWIERERPWLADLGGNRWGFLTGQQGTIRLMWSLRARRDG